MATSAATANALTGPPADIHEDDFPMLRALAQLQELHDQVRFTNITLDALIVKFYGSAKLR